MLAAGLVVRIAQATRKLGRSYFECMEKSRSMSLLLVKLAHTLIWVWLVSCIGVVVWSGVTGRVNRWSWFATYAVLIEGLILLIFRGNCPLTIVARRYSDSRKDNFDIFLPNWLARHNQMIFTTIFALGLGLMLIRWAVDR